MTADRLYDSRHAWFAHELEAHRSTFQCIEGCRRTFAAESEFVQHIQAYHPEIATSGVTSTLKQISLRRVDLSEDATCKLCNKSMTLARLRGHLGHHQEQLALFALPTTMDDSEDGTSEEDDADEKDDSKKSRDEKVTEYQMRLEQLETEIQEMRLQALKLQVSELTEPAKAELEKKMKEIETSYEQNLAKERSRHEQELTQQLELEKRRMRGRYIKGIHDQSCSLM